METNGNTLFDVEGAATYLHLRVKTLNTWRSIGRGPKYVKLGRIFYRKGDLDTWIASRVVDPEAIGGAA